MPFTCQVVARHRVVLEHAGRDARRRDRREVRCRSERQVVEIVRSEVEDRRAAAAELEQAGRSDAAARLLAEAEVLTAHLDAV